MEVDSFAFLPRSFRPLFEAVAPAPGEDDHVWSPFVPRLAEATVGLVTSAGLHVEGEQQPFDAERERREPLWGDPTWRVIDHAVAPGRLGLTHLHIDGSDILADRDVALPVDVLDDLVAEGRVGRATAAHASVMGYQEAGLAHWREVTAPELISFFADQRADGVVLAPV